MGRVSPKGLFLPLAVALVGFHLVSVTAAALPPNRYSQAVAPANGYLDPYFTQNWRLFAPNPVSEDRDILFQASYRTADGSIEATDWVDWTDVELDLVRHRVVGGRGGYVTNKLFSSLSSARSRLTTEQRERLRESSAQKPVGWAELRARLNAAGELPAVVDRYLLYDRATIRLGTDVLLARFPDLDLVAVQYSTKRTPVIPFAERRESAERKKWLRVAASTASGWRRPVAGTPAERAVIADFDRRHR